MHIVALISDQTIPDTLWGIIFNCELLYVWSPSEYLARCCAKFRIEHELESVCLWE